MFCITKPVYDKWNKIFQDLHKRPFEGLVYVVEEGNPLRHFDPKTDISIPDYSKGLQRIWYNYGILELLSSNCGAAVHGNVASSGKLTFDFFEDICSVVGKTVIIGSCFKRDLRGDCLITKAGFKPVYSFSSNRCNQEMAVLVKEIKKPYLKGVGVYYGDIK